MPVISPSRGDLVEIVGALCVNIKLSISSTRAPDSMQKDT